MICEGRCNAGNSRIFTVKNDRICSMVGDMGEKLKRGVDFAEAVELITHDI
ncbi:hypothetical protein D3C85_1882490 [compost metagenome]